MRAVVAAALCAALLASAADTVRAAEGDGEGSVVTMTAKNFDSLTAEGQWLVKFYAVRVRVPVTALRMSP